MSTIVLDTLSYVGEGLLNGVSRFVERSAGVARYFRNLTNSVNYNKTSEKATVKWKLVLPYPATVPAVPLGVGEIPYSDTIVNIDIRVDGRAPLLYREDIVDAIQSLVLLSQFTGSVESLTPAT